jgi:hypothetical protein
MSQLQVNRINDASGGVLAPISSVMRNRIINGAMVISQYNAAASVVPNSVGVMVVDRWRAWEDTDGSATAQQSTVAPAGFSNSLLWTTTSADSSLAATQYCILQQRIEGFNIADLEWGTANAKTITLSFWVRSSLTGTFGGALRNSAANRSYPFTYTINAANTWEYETITIAGDTSGTWLKNNGIGIGVDIGLGVGSTFSGTAGAWAAGNFLSATGATSVIGTSGAIFYITGVQLEVGTQATSFEYRQYQQELALCQRYFYKTYNVDSVAGADTSTGIVFLEALAEPASLNRLKVFNPRLPVSMRTTPTVSAYSQGGTLDRVSIYNLSASTLTVSSINGGGENSLASFVQLTTNAAAAQTYAAHFVASAEL